MTNIKLNGLSEALLASTGCPDGAPMVDQPFKNYGDLTTITATQRYRYFAKSYRADALDSPMDAALAGVIGIDPSSLLLVKQSDPKDLDCGLVEVDKTYANLPQRRTVRQAQAIMRFGYAQNRIEERIVRDMLIIGGYANMEVPSHWLGYVARVWIMRAQGNQTYVYRQAICESNARSSTGVMARFYVGSEQLPSNKATLQAGNTRLARQVVADGYMEYTYVRVANQDEVIPTTVSLYSMVESTTLTTQTFLTVDQYLNMVATRAAYQCAEAQTRVWMGNIIEIETPYVYAI